MGATRGTGMDVSMLRTRLEDIGVGCVTPAMDEGAAVELDADVGVGAETADAATTALAVPPASDPADPDACEAGTAAGWPCAPPRAPRTEEITSLSWLGKARAHTHP